MVLFHSRWANVDSAAIGSWHIGRSPDSRALATMKKHNLPYTNKARQIKKDDFKKYDYIFGMDDDNIDDLNGLCPKDGTAKVLLFGDFDPEGDRIIRDPYYVCGNMLLFVSSDSVKLIDFLGIQLQQDSDSSGFEKAYQQSVRCSKGFLKQL